MTTFYKNYIELCAQKKKSASAVATEVGLSRTSPNGWKNGKKPSDINLEKIANYFGVTVDRLLSDDCRENEKDSAPVSAEPFIGASYLTAEEKQKVNEYIALLLAARQKQ